jgi:hypothetical protein
MLGNPHSRGDLHEVSGKEAHDRLDNGAFLGLKGTATPQSSRWPRYHALESNRLLVGWVR